MAEEKENNKKRNVLLIIVFVLLILSILFASSYAYFKVGVVNNFGNSEVASSIACFDISYSETNVIDLENKYPITDEYAMTDNHLTPVTVTVTNNCTNNNNSIDYVLTYTSLSDSDNYIPDDKMKVAVKRKIGTNEENTAIMPSYVSDLENLTSGTTYNILMNDLSTRQNVSSFPNKVNYVLDRNTIEAGTTNTYKIYMWIDYYEGDTTHEGLNNNSTQNKDYKSALSVVVNSEKMPTNKILVAFDPNGGTLNSIYTSKDVYVGEEYGELPTPAKEGYTFVGWITDNQIDNSFFEQGGIYDTNGENTESRIDRIRFINFFNVSPNSTYLIKTNDTSTDNKIVIRSLYLYNNDGYINRTNGEKYESYEFVVPSNCSSFRIVLERSDSSTSISPSDLSNINVEVLEYVTTNVIVTHAKNHTLKAIWEPIS